MTMLSMETGDAPSFCANASLHTTAAAAPSVVGQHWNLVSGSKITREPRISSTVIAARNWLRSLSTAWRRFLTATLASCSRVVPYLSMCSLPAPPNIWAAGGAGAKPWSACISSMCLSSGRVRSPHFIPSEPFSIFSNPRASAHSTMPEPTAWNASRSADDPVEQLLLTLKTGIPVRPSS